MMVKALVTDKAQVNSCKKRFWRRGVFYCLRVWAQWGELVVHRGSPLGLPIPHIVARNFCPSHSCIADWIQVCTTYTRRTSIPMWLKIVVFANGATSRNFYGLARPGGTTSLNIEWIDSSVEALGLSCRASDKRVWANVCTPCLWWAGQEGR